MDNRFSANKLKLYSIRLMIVIIPIIMFALDKKNLGEGIIVILVYFFLEIIFFIRSVEVNANELVLYYLFRTKVIPITKIRKVEKSTWDSYKEITLYLVDGPMEILEGFVYSKADILLIIDAINNKIESQRGRSDKC